MHNGGYNDDVWDEHKWEAHLNEIEKKSDQLRRFITSDTSGNLPRWMTLLRESTDELDAVDAFIEEELQIEDVYFPDEDDEDWDEDEEDDLDDFFYDEFEEDSFLMDDEDDFDDGEEWKELTSDYAMSDYGSIENLEIYNETRELAAFVLQWAENIHPKYHTPDYHEFVGNILKIGAKMAGGYSFGFEQDYLGANIAYTKKALNCANESLSLLQQSLKNMPYMTPATYLLLHERIFELRNSIGVYIQELREQFYSGL